MYYSSYTTVHHQMAILCHLRFALLNIISQLLFWRKVVLLRTSRCCALSAPIDESVFSGQCLWITANRQRSLWWPSSFLIFLFFLHRVMMFRWRIWSLLRVWVLTCAPVWTGETRSDGLLLNHTGGFNLLHFSLCTFFFLSKFWDIFVADFGV